MLNIKEKESVPAICVIAVEMVKDEDENEAIALIQRQRDKQGRNIEICRIIRPGHDGRPDNMSVIMTCGSATSRASFYRDS